MYCKEEKWFFSIIVLSYYPVFFILFKLHTEYLVKFLCNSKRLYHFAPFTWLTANSHCGYSAEAKWQKILSRVKQLHLLMHAMIQLLFIFIISACAITHTFICKMIHLLETVTREGNFILHTDKKNPIILTDQTEHVWKCAKDEYLVVRLIDFSRAFI